MENGKQYQMTEKRGLGKAIEGNIENSHDIKAAYKPALTTEPKQKISKLEKTTIQKPEIKTQIKNPRETRVSPRS